VAPAWEGAAAGAGLLARDLAGELMIRDGAHTDTGVLKLRSSSSDLLQP
jgi:hypothetical protein